MTNYRTYSDDALVHGLRAGQRAAFDEIYERFWDKLFVTATYRLGDPHEAEDVVQDVMLGLWNRRSALSIQSSLGAYLAVAVKYEVINRLAKQRRKATQLSATPMEEADHSTEQMLDLAALQERLAALVDALPEKCRMAFRLSRDYGYSQKEIAALMDISENTVESHLKRALKTLKTSLRSLMAVLPMY